LYVNVIVQVSDSPNVPLEEVVKMPEMMDCPVEGLTEPVMLMAPPPGPLRTAESCTLNDCPLGSTLQSMTTAPFWSPFATVCGLGLSATPRDTALNSEARPQTETFELLGPTKALTKASGTGTPDSCVVEPASVDPAPASDADPPQGQQEKALPPGVTPAPTQPCGGAW